MTEQSALIDRLLTFGWATTADFISDEQARHLSQQGLAKWSAGAFRPAGVGPGSATRHTAIRGDDILWLDQEEADCPAGKLLGLFEELRKNINRVGQLGLFELEAHFAIYPPGQGYARHLDQFRTDDRRQVSVVCYLNDAWSEADGGALRLYLGDGTYHDILPRAGTLVVFMSAQFPHEVLPARRQRLSVTGWFKRRP